MNIFFFILLFILGTMFGSFASVLVYRIRSGEGGIMGGRSHCKTCERNLSPKELIPLISWLIQRGKCVGCKKEISSTYPLLELTTGILFTCVGYFLVSPELIFYGNIFEILTLVLFLGIIFLTVVYVFYDIEYQEIPENILVWANVLAFGGLIAQGYGYTIFPYLPVGNLDIITLIVSSGVIGALYYMMRAGLSNLFDLLILTSSILILGGYIYLGNYNYQEIALLSGTIAALGIFVSLYLQILLSGGRAMGQGDLRIAILMGLITGVSFAFPAWMICYLVGSISGLIIIGRSKIKNGFTAPFKKEIPFGPFLACGYLVILFFHPQISSLIEMYFT